MPGHFEEIGVVAALFFRHCCVGIIPTAHIKLGDRLVFCCQRQVHSAPAAEVTVDAIQVNYLNREEANPGEKCSTAISSFPLQALKKGMTVFRVEEDTQSGMCPKSPSHWHRWVEECRPLYNFDAPPERCIHCGAMKTT
jgi:hypothetical protein